MSDYEDESIPMETDEYNPTDVDLSVVTHLTVTIKKGQAINDVSLYIKYYEERDAIDAESDEYYSDMNIIEPFIARLHPGWSIEGIRSEGFSDSSYFDLDATSNE